MVGLYDLFDISQAFILIRSDIRYNKNIEILNKIIEVISAENYIETNQIRISISGITDLDKNIWSYCFYKNLYTNITFLKNQRIINILIKACKELISVLKSENYNKAYDLVDAIHCLPDIITENKMSVTKTYWKNHIDHYRKKWDKEFLKKEQIELYR